MTEQWTWKNDERCDNCEHYAASRVQNRAGLGICRLEGRHTCNDSICGAWGATVDYTSGATYGQPPLPGSESAGVRNEPTERDAMPMT